MAEQGIVPRSPELQNSFLTTGPSFLSLQCSLSGMPYILPDICFVFAWLPILLFSLTVYISQKGVRQKEQSRHQLPVIDAASKKENAHCILADTSRLSIPFQHKTPRKPYACTQLCLSFIGVPVIASWLLCNIGFQESTILYLLRVLALSQLYLGLLYRTLPMSTFWLLWLLLLVFKTIKNYSTSDNFWFGWFGRHGAS